jgi:hypothetical protein
MSESTESSPLLVAIVVLAVLILLAVTNPSAEAHRKAISTDYEKERPIAGAVGLGALSSRLPEYRSVVIGSYTTEGDVVVSVGALGMVWVVDVEVEDQ